MEIFRTLNSSSRSDHWKNGTIWLGWVVIGGMMPLWGKLMGRLFFDQDINLYVFTNTGEFTLFAAAFLSGSLYIVVKDFKKRSFPSKDVLVLLMFSLLALSVFMFAQISVTEFLATANATANATNQLTINKKVVAIFSVLILPISILLSWLVVVTDNVRIDISEMKSDQLDSLSEEFDNIGD